ncbi:MAG TPA: nuclear transport factor 2 family protein [Pyrinomonadaceae bacterium]|nr:nuclear transport factor 2 family protein [Pyrinomonadaceae bacterium]
MRSSFSGTILFVLVSTALAASSACSNQSKSNGNANAGVTAEPTPDKAAIEAQLKALEYDWPRILKERDGAAVRKLEADDIMILSPDGADGTKDGDIQDIEAGQMAGDPQEISDVTVNVLDNDSAVVRSRTTVKGDNHVLSDGKCQTIIHEFRTIDTFVRRNGQWQIVASATVPVRNPGPASSPSSTPRANASPNGSPATDAPAVKTSPVSSGSAVRKPTPQ